MANNTQTLTVDSLFPEFDEALTLLGGVEIPVPQAAPNSKNKQTTNLVVEPADTRFLEAKNMFLRFLQDTIEGNQPAIPETGFPTIQEAMLKVQKADTALGEYFDHPQWDDISAKFIEKIDPLYDELLRADIRVILDKRRANYSTVLSQRSNSASNASSIESNGSEASTVRNEGEQVGEEQDGGRRRRYKKARKTKRKSRKAKRKQRKTRRR